MAADRSSVRKPFSDCDWSHNGWRSIIPTARLDCLQGIPEHSVMQAWNTMASFFVHSHYAIEKLPPVPISEVDVMVGVDEIARA